uniref:ORF17 protein n=1 Tax=Psittacine aviadenovirus B TaxID=2169709 RepID=A0AB38ZPC2_9ADEN
MRNGTGCPHLSRPYVYKRKSFATSRGNGRLLHDVSDQKVTGLSSFGQKNVKSSGNQPTHQRNRAELWTIGANEYQERAQST